MSGPSGEDEWDLRPRARLTWRDSETELGWSRLEATGWRAPEVLSVGGDDWERARFQAKLAALRTP